mmetsp:Transcript_9080/g.13172  ORF Transcript_9080/g.13172 Transcript_9080/m.13172 type:complete len:237 (-) Transcript_9080:24-734(-)
MTSRRCSRSPCHPRWHALRKRLLAELALDTVRPMGAMTRSALGDECPATPTRAAPVRTRATSSPTAVARVWRNSLAATLPCLLDGEDLVAARPTVIVGSSSSSSSSHRRNSSSSTRTQAEHSNNKDATGHLAARPSAPTRTACGIPRTPSRMGPTKTRETTSPTAAALASMHHREDARPSPLDEPEQRGGAPWCLQHNGDKCPATGRFGIGAPHPTTSRYFMRFPLPKDICCLFIT